MNPHNYPEYRATMKTLFIMPLLLLLSLISFPSWSADFDKGNTAAKKGDFATAVKEWTPLAEQGDARAQVSLGMLYVSGAPGVAQDDDKIGVKWITLAAEQEYADAQVILGMMYEKGKGVQQDDEAAVKWYTLAAEQGNARAQLKLDEMYEKGK